MYEPVIDQFYVPHIAFQGKAAPRRVLAIGNGFVLFSDGAKKTKECTLDQWQKWIDKFSVTRATAS